MSLAEFATNKLRTALTMLGIVIGVCAVIALMAAGQGASAGLAATEPGYQQIRNVTMAAGNFISQDDMTRKNLAAVIGAQVAQDLFGTPAQALGQQISASFGRFALNFTVIGVAQRRGGSSPDDTTVIIP